jgi:hypothetical protein
MRQKQKDNRAPSIRISVAEGLQGEWGQFARGAAWGQDTLTIRRRNSRTSPVNESCLYDVDVARLPLNCLDPRRRRRACSSARGRKRRRSLRWSPPPACQWRRRDARRANVEPSRCIPSLVAVAAAALPSISRPSRLRPLRQQRGVSSGAGQRRGARLPACLCTPGGARRRRRAGGRAPLRTGRRDPRESEPPTGMSTHAPEARRRGDEARLPRTPFCGRRWMAREFECSAWGGPSVAQTSVANTHGKWQAPIEREARLCKRSGCPRMRDPCSLRARLDGLRRRVPLLETTERVPPSKKMPSR